jgi:hypothetical protein
MPSDANILTGGVLARTELYFVAVLEGGAFLSPRVRGKATLVPAAKVADPRG